MCNGQISTAGELFFKSKYIESMQNNTKWYWGKSKQQNNMIVSTCTFVRPCLYVIIVTEVKHIPKNVYNRNQARKDLQRHHIFLTNSYHDFTLDEI